VRRAKIGEGCSTSCSTAGTFCGAIKRHSNLTAVSPDHAARTPPVSVGGEKKHELIGRTVDFDHGALLGDIAQLPLPVGNPTGVRNLSSWTGTALFHVF
jgi:hypothetical protein